MNLRPPRSTRTYTLFPYTTSCRSVRLVISLGSPISENREHTKARHLFEYFNRDVPEAQNGGRFKNLAKAPPLPTTSILTRTDGIVHWRGSLQHPGSTPSENIEVRASHCGLGVNPSVMIAIADRKSTRLNSSH